MRAWASAQPIIRSAAATHDQIERHLEFLAATLPSKAIDTETGKRRFAVYVSLLAGFSGDALANMARRACETLDWFPTPRQCLDLARDYEPPQSSAVLAISQCDHFDQRIFEDWIASITDGGEPNMDVPQRWIEIALTRTLLRKLPDGTVVTRARYREINAHNVAA